MLILLYDISLTHTKHPVTYDHLQKSRLNDAAMRLGLLK